MEDSGKTYPVMELDVEITDAIVQEDMTNDQFYPYFKHLVRNNGTLQFQLYTGCPCKLAIRFEFETRKITQREWVLCLTVSVLFQTTS